MDTLLHPLHVSFTSSSSKILPHIPAALPLLTLPIPCMTTSQYLDVFMTVYVCVCVHVQVMYTYSTCVPTHLAIPLLYSSIVVVMIAISLPLQNPAQFQMERYVDNSPSLSNLVILCLQQVKLEALFSGVNVAKVTEMSLSLLQEKGQVRSSGLSVYIPPMEIQTYRISWHH